jgi:thymidylate kinase
MLEQWRAQLDWIVWLDAPDGVLHERIQQRQQGHVLEGRGPAESSALLARYRTAFSEILDLLAGPAGPQVLRIDTGGVDPETVHQQVSEALPR